MAGQDIIKEYVCNNPLRHMNIMDMLLGGFRLYRKWRKGCWMLITPKPYPYLTVWIRNTHVLPYEELLKEECYE